MRRPGLARLALLVFALRAPGALAISPDLAEIGSRIERFPEMAGNRSESARLKEFFELYWAARVREFPDLAVWSGYPGLSDRWPDLSPESIAFIRRTPACLPGEAARRQPIRLATLAVVTHELFRPGATRGVRRRPVTDRDRMLAVADANEELFGDG